jgi:GTP-binding protein
VFRDQVKIFVRSGAGGAGSLHFRREKYVPRGGPDGGDGGRGGTVYAVADPGLNTLHHYAYHRHHRATPGGNGTMRRRHGSAGDDLLLPLPVGTVIRDADTGVTLGDLAEPGQRVQVARGGRGGLGNTHFATATYQAPHVAEKGEPGEERTLLLELKLIADVGLAGLPNAGKSTLLAHITAARPKIADYPFTTITPNLGVAVVDDYSFVVADIPGLIEGAHDGLGLGHEFLRHVERTSVLIHVVDGADGVPETILAHIQVINNELDLYSAQLRERPQVVAVNKMDIPSARENWPAVCRALEETGVFAFPISAVSGEGIEPMVRQVRTLLEQARLLEAAQRPVLERVIVPPTVDEMSVDKLPGGGFRVHGKRAERVVAMTDMASEEGLDRLQTLLRRFGVTHALEEAGVVDGSLVSIGSAELVWGDVEEEPASRRLTRRQRIARRDPPD